MRKYAFFLLMPILLIAFQNFTSSNLQSTETEKTNTLIVSVDGTDDNEGTCQSPKSVSSALLSLKPNTTVYFLPGVYLLSESIKIEISGTNQEKMIRLIGDQNPCQQISRYQQQARASLLFKNLAKGKVLLYGSFLEFSGFDLTQENIYIKKTEKNESSETIATTTEFINSSSLMDIMKARDPLLYPSGVVYSNKNSKDRIYIDTNREDIMISSRPRPGLQYTVTGNIISRNRISFAGEECIKLYLNIGAAILQNSCRFVFNEGLDIMASRGTTVKGNIILNAGRIGILFKGLSKDSIASKNRIINNKVPMIDSAIAVGGATGYTSLVDYRNEFKASGSYEALRIKVIGNTIMGSEATPIVFGISFIGAKESLVTNNQLSFVTLPTSFRLGGDKKSWSNGDPESWRSGLLALPKNEGNEFSQNTISSPLDTNNPYVTRYGNISVTIVRNKIQQNTINGEKQ